MASSSGASFGSSTPRNSGSEGDQVSHVMDERKKKRMLSNRESAKRSRMRKQKHLDNLMAQVGELEMENSKIIARINIITHNYQSQEAHNLVLKTQMAELSNRLESLNEIIDYINSSICLFEETDNALNNNGWNEPTEP